MTDIVDRLRQATKPRWKMTGEADAGVVEMANDPLAQEAADEIERLRAALREIADWPSSRTLPSRTEHALQDIAREALGDECIGCGAHDAPHQTVDGSMCSTCLANTGGAG